jgi:hypothetical protein
MTAGAASCRAYVAGATGLDRDSEAAAAACRRRRDTECPRADERRRSGLIAA